ncbi:MAG TPA: type II secretion system F family protein [Aeromicrobium sp.]|nr:type II secretion system F family protein [Aeromicrobium sp.]
MAAAIALFTVTGGSREEQRRFKWHPMHRSEAALERTSAYLVDRTDQILSEGRFRLVSAREFELAGIRRPPGEIIVFVAIVATMLSVATLVLTGQVLLALMAALILPVAGRAWLTVKLDKRRDRFADQLDEALDIVAASLRAGHSFPTALDAVAQNTDDPIAPEFTRIINENRVGRDLIEAMHQTADRMESEDFRWVTEVVSIQRETGGNLNEIIGLVAETIRARKELREEVKALASEGRFSAIVLMALPPFVGTAFFLVNPDYAADLLFTSVGQMVLFVSAVLYVVGGLWFRSIVRVEY